MSNISKTVYIGNGKVVHVVNPEYLMRVKEEVREMEIRTALEGWMTAYGLYTELNIPYKTISERINFYREKIQSGLRLFSIWEIIERMNIFIRI